MLSFFKPVVLRQALELRVKVRIVLDVAYVMAFAHPFDMQDRKSDARRIVGEDAFAIFDAGPKSPHIPTRSFHEIPSGTSEKRMCFASSPAN